MSKITAFRTPALIAIALLLPVTCAAQGTTGGEVRRPYKALFGGDPNDTATSSLSINLFGGYDDNVLPVDSAETDPRFQASNLTGGVAATLMLQRAGEKASFGVGLSSAMRYFDNGQEFRSAAHGVALRGSFHPQVRTSIGVTGGFTWAPLYSPLLSASGFGAEASNEPAAFYLPGDYAAAVRPANFWNGGISLSHALTRRASLMAGYGMHLTDYTEEDQQQRSDTGRGGISYRLTRYSNLRFLYNRTSYRLSNGMTRRTLHDFGGGIDYRRPLSLSGRRTTFTVTPGWALTERSGDLRLHVTGVATLEHEMGRTWTAYASYRRGLRFIDGLETEFLANTAMTSIGGQLSRRVGLTFGGQLSVSDRSGGNRDYSSFWGGARISYALSRHLSAYAQYVYFGYRFGESVVLPGLVGRRLDRQGVRVGLTLWAPLLR